MAYFVCFYKFGVNQSNSFLSSAASRQTDIFKWKNPFWAQETSTTYMFTNNLIFDFLLSWTLYPTIVFMWERKTTLPSRQQYLTFKKTLRVWPSLSEQTLPSYTSILIGLSQHLWVQNSSFGRNDRPPPPKTHKTADEYLRITSVYMNLTWPVDYQKNVLPNLNNRTIKNARPMSCERTVEQ